MNLINNVFITITTTIIITITITTAVSAISAAGSRGLLGCCCWQHY